MPLRISKDVMVVRVVISLLSNRISGIVLKWAVNVMNLLPVVLSYVALIGRTGRIISCRCEGYSKKWGREASIFIGISEVRRDFF